MYVDYVFAIIGNNFNINSFTYKLNLLYPLINSSYELEKYAQLH